MKKLWVLLLLWQCHSTHHVPTVIVTEAIYHKVAEDNGDKAIHFQFLLQHLPAEVEVNSLLVNAQTLEFELTRETERSLIQAFKVYPAPPGGRGIDPLPPGEEGNILYFQDSFSAEIVLTHKGKTDTLKVEEFVALD